MMFPNNPYQPNLFQNFMQQPIQNTPSMPNFYNGNVTQVNGINGANSFSLGANSSVLLLDSQLPIVYLKKSDGAGYSTVQAFDLVEHKDNKISIEDIESRLKKLEEKFNEPVVKSNSKSSSKQHTE